MSVIVITAAWLVSGIAGIVLIREWERLEEIFPSRKEWALVVGGPFLLALALLICIASAFEKKVKKP